MAPLQPQTGPNKLTVAVVQMCSSPDANENLATLGKLLRQAHACGAQMALLPENVLCMGKTEGDKWHSADVLPDWSWRDRVLQLGVDYGLGLIAGSLYCREEKATDPRVTARCWVSELNGQVCGFYDKRHLFDVTAREGESYRESSSIRPGENGPTVVAAQGVQWGLSICYDLRFPEHYRSLVEQGAVVMTVPAAFTETTGEAHWEVLLRARAIENQCYVLAANQGGEHASGRKTFGNSMIIDPWGRVLSRCGREPEVICAELDFQELAKLRRQFPALEHRREVGE